MKKPRMMMARMNQGSRWYSVVRPRWRRPDARLRLERDQRPGSRWLRLERQYDGPMRNATVSEEKIIGVDKAARKTLSRLLSL